MALQTKTLTANGSKGHHKFTLTVVEESIDTVNNTSTLSYKFKISPVQTGWNWASYNNISFTVKAGNAYYAGYIADYDGKSTVIEASGTSVVPHDENGNRDITIEFEVKDPNTSVSYTCGNASKSDTMSLTFIPRKSSLTASSGTLGTAQALTINPKADIFTHTLTYKCGTASGAIATKTSNTDISFTPPLSLASQNTTGTSVSVTFTLETFNESTSIGSVDKTISCAIPSSVKPSVTINASDSLGYADTYGGYIQGLSKLDIELNITEAYGAEIVTKSVTVDGATYTSENVITEVLRNTGNRSISATVKDQRSRSGTATKSYTVLAYSAPKISKLSVIRCDASGNENINGEYVKAVFSASVTSLNSKNTATYKLGYKKSTASNYTELTLTDYAGSYSVTNGSEIFAADSGSSYNVRITVTDDFKETTYETRVSTAFALMHWGASGTNMGIGTLAEEDNTLAIGLKTLMHNNRLTELPTPTENTDAVNKAYVDALISQKQSNIYNAALPSSVDLNSYVTPCEYFCGTYAIWQSLTNAPPKTTAGIFKVTTSSNGYYIYQEWLSITGDRFTRTGSNYGASWHAWAKTMTNANITAAYSVLLSFSEGKATYSNSAITANSIVIVQRRSSSVGNNQSFNVSSNAGSVTICTDASISVNLNLNIIIINL